MDAVAPRNDVTSPSASERCRRTAQRLVTLLDEDGPGALQIAITSLRPADIGAALGAMEPKQRLQVFIAMPPELAGEVLEELRPELRDELLGDSDDSHLTQILAQADADDAVYFLDHLDDDRAAKLLTGLDEKLRGQLSEQYELPEETAGRIMTRDIITLRSFLTAAQALAHVQSHFQENNHHFSTLYVVDAESRLVGVLPFRQLVFAPTRACLSTIMDRDVLSVSPDTDREAVARLMQKYHLLTIPVVDGERRIRGMVTWDDAVDVLEAEAEEDLMAIAGTAESSEDNDSVWKRAWLRMPWLVITAIGGFINAKVISGYGASLNTQMLLVGFMPLVGAMGGNIGLQCSTVTVRGLATGAIVHGHMMASIVREISTGMLLAFAMALFCGIGGSLIAWSNGDNAALGVIMATSLLLAVMLAAALGVLIPLACTRLRIDPAIAAGPFITMLNDVSGYVIYITTVNVLLRAMA
jgi:magnesium transporter